MNTVRAHPARRDPDLMGDEPDTVWHPFNTNARGPSVVQEYPACAKLPYIYQHCTSPDAFGRAIYNTAL